MDHSESNSHFYKTQQILQLQALYERLQDNQDYNCIGYNSTGEITQGQGGRKLTLLWPQVWWCSVQLLKTQQRGFKIITYPNNTEINNEHLFHFIFKPKVSSSASDPKYILIQQTMQCQFKQFLFSSHYNFFNSISYFLISKLSMLLFSLKSDVVHIHYKNMILKLYSFTNRH